MVTISLCMIVKMKKTPWRVVWKASKELQTKLLLWILAALTKLRQLPQNTQNRFMIFPGLMTFQQPAIFLFPRPVWITVFGWMQTISFCGRLAGLLELKQILEPDTDVVMMKYHIAFDKAGKPTYSYYRERLLRRQAAFSGTALSMKSSRRP